LVQIWHDIEGSASVLQASAALLCAMLRSFVLCWPWCAVLQMLELVADYARIKYGPGSFELTDPSTPAAARYAAVQRFNAAATAAAGSQAKQPFIYLITPRSIGLGTQLPGLSAAIIFESDWHPRLDIQALHR
jgi:SNF2 family DNA or RNA helicase